WPTNLWPSRSTWIRFWMSQSQAHAGWPSSASLPADQTLTKSVGMPRPFGSVIHQCAKYAVGKNAALMTSSTKQALNSDAGMACGSEMVGVETGAAMGCPWRAATRAVSINKADRLEEILRFERRYNPN